MSTKFWLTNVRLESGYDFEDGLVRATKTEICNILVEDGTFREIVAASTPLQTELPAHDAEKHLLLPAFKDMHVHLDKTLIGDAWRAPFPVSNIIERSQREKRILHSLSTTTKERAEKLLDILLRSGSTHVRTHVDIHPELGLKNLEAVQKALLTFEGKLNYEIVAFPDFGLVRANLRELVREALHSGANLVGGVDPATVDGNVEASLQMMMELAVESNTGVDLHLHDPSHLGTYTMKRLAEITVDAGWQGRVSISHAFGLGELSEGEATEMADILADAGITIITHVPINRPIPPVPLLHERGVAVAVGSDNIFDSWQPFGNGDMLDRASRLAERFRWNNELSLSQTLGFITGGKTVLDKQGNRIWPKQGDEASGVLVEASCSAEAVARKARRHAVLKKGILVFGKLSCADVDLS
ncbi:amidohydrolase [Brevibacillus centrosporus]|uniref:amidohydrolase n=1 Tax=Brevibacillus centrosporus TaxID=54910 RepID=UPI002E1FB6B7|nr:amidohydrolase [Brevibacillus centrosporus]MED1949614.1 amidohydrolase [Brevibacillus centrosporus]